MHQFPAQAHVKGGQAAAQVLPRLAMSSTLRSSPSSSCYAAKAYLSGPSRAN